MKLKSTSASFAALFCVLNTGRAATITYAGFVENNTVNNWRTAATAKPMDPDGDNIYGTLGAVHWTVVGANEFASGSASAGWHYVGETSFGQFRNPGYAVVDNLQNPAADIEAGIGAVGTPGSFTFQMTGTAATYAGKTLRVGVMADILTAGEWAADITKTFQLTGMSGNSGTISLRSGGPGNGQPEMYFFDIAGATAGDTYTLTAGTSSGQAGYIGPVTWDLYTVPEPSAFLLAGLTGLPLLRRRRA
jgi:MYXO-CTERM domain-containing protein